METKNFIRKAVLQQRSLLTKNEQNEKSMSVWSHLENSGLLQNCSCILNYADFRQEVHTGEILNFALNGKIPLFYPKVEGSNMSFYRVNGMDDLKNGYQSIQEPAGDSESYSSFKKSLKNSHGRRIVIVPGSVFSREGGRYGYGKGFYDRFLKENRELIRVALGYEFQVMKCIPAEPYDMRMDYIITDERIYAVNRREMKQE